MSVAEYCRRDPYTVQRDVSARKAAVLMKENERREDWGDDASETLARELEALREWVSARAQKR